MFKMDDKYFEILAIIAARKSAYYINVRSRLLIDLKTNGLLKNVDEQELRGRLRKTIAELPNNLFLSMDEKSKKFIYSDLPIEKLNLNREEIKDRILRELGC